MRLHAVEDVAVWLEFIINTINYILSLSNFRINIIWLYFPLDNFKYRPACDWHPESILGHRRHKWLFVPRRSKYREYGMNNVLHATVSKM